MKGHTLTKSPLPEGVKKLPFSRHPDENRGPGSSYGLENTGFRRLPRTRSGVRRNDGKKTQADFFTPSPIEGGGNVQTILD